LEKLVTNASKLEAVRAFGDEDIEYLAPLLAAGLTRAASDQQILFRVVKSVAPIQSQSGGLTFCLSDVRSPGVCESEQSSGAISEESTACSLFAYGQSLYVTLTEYRHRTKRADTSSAADRRFFNPAGLANRTVHFVPESAKRPDSYRTARSTDATLVIDYGLLATMPLTPEMRSTPSHSPTPVKGEPGQRDADMDEVRKELREIKKKLAEQESERTRPTVAPSKNPTLR
jgi:hypothetical protein